MMIAVAGLTVTAGVVAEPGPPGASPWVLVWALVTAVVLLLAHRGLDPGWVAWRRATLGLVGVALSRATPPVVRGSGFWLPWPRSGTCR